VSVTAHRVDGRLGVIIDTGGFRSFGSYFGHSWRPASFCIGFSECGKNERHGNLEQGTDFSSQLHVVNDCYWGFQACVGSKPYEISEGSYKMLH